MPRQYRESQLQESCVAWFRATYPKLARLLVYVNNNSVSAKAGARNRRLGVVAGIPDLILFCPNLDSCALFIEMKAPKGRPAPAQLTLHAQLETQGYRVEIVKTLASFKDLIREYLSGVTLEGVQKL